MSRAACLLVLVCVAVAPFRRADAAARAWAEVFAENARGDGSAEAPAEPEDGATKLFASTPSEAKAPLVPSPFDLVAVDASFRPTRPAAAVEPAGAGPGGRTAEPDRLFVLRC